MKSVLEYATLGPEFVSLEACFEFFKNSLLFLTVSPPSVQLATKALFSVQDAAAIVEFASSQLVLPLSHT